jgi:hypothetical protein
MPYNTGYGATVTISNLDNGATITDAKVVTLPTPAGRGLDVEHLGGIDVVAESYTTYGQLAITIPMDGSTQDLISDEVVTITGTVPRLGGTFTVTGNCVADSLGSLARGQAMERSLTYHCHSRVSWTPIGS